MGFNGIYPLRIVNDPIKWNITIFVGGQMNYQWAIFHSYVANYQQVSVFLTVHLVLDTLETELQSPLENSFNGRHASCMFFFVVGATIQDGASHYML